MTDLSATISRPSASVSVSFTEPGDDGDLGTVDSFELRYAYSAAELLEDFQGLGVLVEDFVVAEEPQGVGSNYTAQVETVTLQRSVR